MVLYAFSTSKKFHRQFFLFLLAVFTATAVADGRQRPLVLSGSEPSLSAAPYLDVLEDPSGKLSLAEITSPAYADKFQPNKQNSQGFGKTRSAYWLRFELINHSELKWYLLLDAKLEDELSLYILPESATAYAQKLANYRQAAWSLALPRSEKLQLYIRATDGGSLLNIPVELLSADAMLERSNTETAWNYANKNIIGIGALLFVLLMSVIQAERVRKLRESMQHAAIACETKDRFLASMNHELRTPLNAIFGISTLLRLSRLDETQSTYVEKLEASTRHMLQLVGNILDIKKIENKSFHLDVELFKLKSVISALNDILKAQAEAKNLVLNFTDWESITENLYGDKLRLMQILINLLNNAIKFTEFGSVTLSVQKLASYKPGIVCLYFSVTDTGVGISQDKLHYLFQPFMQLKKRSNSVKEGAGLGLAISKNLVEMMGGTLEVNSSPGIGSQFYFSLNFGLHDRRSSADLQDRRKYRGMHGRRYSLRMQDRRNALKAYDRRKSQPQEIAALDSALLLPAGTQILLVDDYDLNLFVGQKLLANLGGEVAVAGNGQSAILQLQQHRFDIVLLDLSMADMDGFEVTAWIRRYGQQPNIPIIALTAQATPAIEQQCRDTGMNGFLTKPFTLQDLHTIIVKNVHDISTLTTNTDKLS